MACLTVAFLVLRVAEQAADGCDRRAAAARPAPGSPPRPAPPGAPWQGWLPATRLQLVAGRCAKRPIPCGGEVVLAHQQSDLLRCKPAVAVQRLGLLPAADVATAWPDPGASLPPTPPPRRVTLQCTRCLWTSALPRPCPTRAGSGRGGGSAAPLPTPAAPQATPLGHMPSAPPPRSGRRGRGSGGGIGPRPPPALLLGRLRAASAAEKLPPFHCIVPVLGLHCSATDFCLRQDPRCCRPSNCAFRPPSEIKLQPVLTRARSPFVLPRLSTTCARMPGRAWPRTTHVFLSSSQNHPLLPKPICPELPFEQWPPLCRRHTPPPNHPPTPPFWRHRVPLVHSLLLHHPVPTPPVCAAHPCLRPCLPPHLSFPPYIRGFA